MVANVRLITMVLEELLEHLRNNERVSHQEIETLLGMLTLVKNVERKQSQLSEAEVRKWLTLLAQQRDAARQTLEAYDDLHRLMSQWNS